MGAIQHRAMKHSRNWLNPFPAPFQTLSKFLYRKCALGYWLDLDIQSSAWQHNSKAVVTATQHPHLWCQHRAELLTPLLEKQHDHSCSHLKERQPTVLPLGTLPSNLLQHLRDCPTKPSYHFPQATTCPVHPRPQRPAVSAAGG